MVLESVITPARMEKTPQSMFYIGVAYSTVGLLLAYWTFGAYRSISGVFLTAMPLVVVMCRLLKFEEKKEECIATNQQLCKAKKRTYLIKEHKDAISFFMYLFLGILISYLFWSTLLPEELSSSIFKSQLETIETINPSVTGNVAYPNNPLGDILYNNFKVLVFCILFSFLYGSGAIFILTWNASVVGVAIGTILRRTIMQPTFNGKHALYGYLSTFSISMSFAVHGIPEIAAYFIGALGGGIISVATVNHKVNSCQFRKIVIDSLDLILLSAAVLLIAGILEVYVSPNLT